MTIYSPSKVPAYFVHRNANQRIPTTPIHEHTIKFFADCQNTTSTLRHWS